MGRLRNLSASFKAAAFPSASTTSNTAYTRALPDSTDKLNGQKESLGIVRETSANSIPGSSTSVRPGSVIYSAPTLRTPANEEIEELKPVFRYGAVLTELQPHADG